MNSQEIKNQDLVEIELGDYLLRGTDLYKVEHKEDSVEEKYIANAAKVKKIIRKIEDNDILVEIEYFSFGKWETLTLPRGKLIKSELPTLLNKGMDVAGYKANHVFQFLDFHEKQVSPSYYHQGLGWIKYEDNLTFRLQQAIQINSKFSNYEGYFSLGPRGSEKTWTKIIKEEVIGHPPLELVLSASFAAPIAAMLNIEQKADVDSLLFHIIGNSTTGKTTAATVAVSPFGSPSINQNGLIQSFNGTSNALQSLISENFGVPLVFDETSMNMMSQNELTSFVYKLAQNKEKARLNKESRLKDTSSWCTVIIFTGENSILSQANKNEGLRVRLFEFKNIQWTKDGEHAERIKLGLMNNYGHAGTRYIQHLLNQGVESVLKKWNEFKVFILEKLPETKFKARIAGKFATVLCGAFYANEALGLGISIDDVADLLVEQELESMDERELAPKFYELLKQKIIQYRKHFKVNNTPPGVNQEIWGKAEIKNNKTYCFILPTIYDQLSSELGFADSNVLLDELKKMNVLHHDANRLKTKKQVFSKDEIDLREKVIGKKEYSPKGDYTICVVYEGGIFDGYDSNTRINRTIRSRNVNNADQLIE